VKNQKNKIYAIWKKHLGTNSSIKKNQSMDATLLCSKPTVSETIVNKDDYISSGMNEFIEFIVKTVDSESIQGTKGWIDHFYKYEQAHRNKSCKREISTRRTFNLIVNETLNSKGTSSQLSRQTICNAVAECGSMNATVSDKFVHDIFSTVKYLKSVKDSNTTNCDLIYGTRIEAASKLYHFSDPCNWTIYDPRVSYALNQFAYLFRECNPELYHNLSGMIEFPVPANKLNRSSLFSNEFGESNFSLWFVRASLIMQEIAKQLNENEYEKPCIQMDSIVKWKLYHVEMVLFMLGDNMFA
jgi:hypothetical protein